MLQTSNLGDQNLCILYYFEILVDEAAKGNKPSNTFKLASFALVAKSISEKFGVEMSGPC
jgi:hypothetical protein